METKLSSSSHYITLVAMESTHEKLKCLDYEIHFVINLQQKVVERDEFIMPAKNTALQFNHYIELVRWLISLLKHDSKHEIDPYDDPNYVANQLMLVLKDLELKMNFPVTKLKRPHGEVACTVLDFLTDKALEVSEFTFGSPEYISEANEDTNNSILDEFDTRADGTTNDSRSSQSEEDIPDYEILDLNNNSHTVNEDNQMIKSKIDRMEWKSELERVDSKLIIRREEGPVQEDWRDHLRQAKTEQESISAELNSCCSSLEFLSQDMSVVSGKIEEKENVINDKFREINQELQSLYDKTKQMQQTQLQTNTSVTELKQKLVQLNNRLERTKEIVDKKGNSITDTTPLVQIKTTLQQIKAEIKDYDLQIGILEQTILRERIQDSEAKHEKTDDVANQSIDNIEI